ncbi:MAG: 3-phosphoshikimate 1-carboxyvinyltransferase [Pseudomonadota bacterium]
MTGLVSNKISGLNGFARVPGDKSISHRSLMFGALASGETTVTGLLEGEDVFRTAKALMVMGVSISSPDAKNDLWRIRGMGETPLRAPASALDLGNSGTSARLLMGLVAGYPVSASFTGDDSLSRRPMGRVIRPLEQMGARFEMSVEDRLPLRITGSAALRPIHYLMPVASAQVKSAILLAGLHAHGKTTVTEPQPTRDHTERMLEFFGARVMSETQPDGSCSVTLEGGQELTGRNVVVPSDPSSAAFLTVAALITEDSDIVIPNVLMNPRRTGLYDTLIEMGADISFENANDEQGEPVADIRVRSSVLKGVRVPPRRVPSMIDEFPILSVAAAFADGDTVMTDLAELRVKESDRLAAIAKGLAAAGVKADMGKDSLTVHGCGRDVKGGCTVETNLDHRIAMFFLILGLASRSPVTVDNAKTIATSFPDFAALLNGLGARIGAA